MMTCDDDEAALTRWNGDIELAGEFHRLQSTQPRLNSDWYKVVCRRKLWALPCFRLCSHSAWSRHRRVKTKPGSR